MIAFILNLIDFNFISGTVIMIRLREPHDNSCFLPWESILGTMLHELCHNAIGAHSAEFYKLLDQLWNEVEENGSKPWTVIGKNSKASDYTFEGGYRKLGSDKIRSTPSVNDAKRLAAEAAIKRQKYNTVSDGSGHRLGGTYLPKDKMDLRQLAATAAERRLKDDLTCQNATSTVRNQSSTDNISRWICENCLEENTLSQSKICSFCGSQAVEEHRDGQICQPCQSTTTATTTARSSSTSSSSSSSLSSSSITSSATSNRPLDEFLLPSAQSTLKSSRVQEYDVVDLTSPVTENETTNYENDMIETVCPACTFLNRIWNIRELSFCEMCDTNLTNY